MKCKPTKQPHYKKKWKYCLANNFYVVYEWREVDNPNDTRKWSYDISYLKDIVGFALAGIMVSMFFGFFYILRLLS